MQERFEKFFNIIELVEGGYANVKDDLGKETYKGITRKNHPNLTVWSSLDRLSTLKEKKAYTPSESELDEIKSIYHKNYYEKLKCDHYNNELLAAHIFAFGVNAGTSRAAKLLQKVLGITQDGIVGQQTIGTANIKNGVAQCFINEILNYYNSIGKGTQAKFLKGWLSRVNIVTKEVTK